MEPNEPIESYWEAIEPIWDDVSVESSTVFLEQFGSLSRPQQDLFALHWFYCQVLNGRLHQFFLNPWGVMAPEAVIGLRAIGLLNSARILESAMAFFGPVYPREQPAREALLLQVPGESREEWDPFFALDAELFPLLKTENGGFDQAADRYWFAVRGK